MTTQVKDLLRSNKQEAKRFAKFVVVGVTGTLVDFTLFTILKKWFGWHTLPSNTTSFTLAVINNFIWNRYWTYPDSRTKPIQKQLVQFFIINIIGWSINTSITLGLEHPFGAFAGRLWAPAAHYGAWISKAFATGIVLFWNFFVNRYWTYNDVKKH